ncbi:MAG: hypothetical protein GX055_09335 [Desulfovibrionales bacterium]|nr:hypothetical protein [Desulfovibrionales bacterium]
MKERQEQGAGHVVLRGILIGGSIGMMASWFGYAPAKAFFFGIFSGIFAAVTKIMAEKIRQNRS